MDNNKTNESNSNDSMLTTIDNPYNPFTQFDDWYAFDVSNGYNTSAYLARIVKSSQELSEEDEALATEQAIDDIVRLNILGIYRKVNRSSFKDISKFVRIPVVDTVNV